MSALPRPRTADDHGIACSNASSRRPHFASQRKAMLSDRHASPPSNRRGNWRAGPRVDIGGTNHSCRCRRRRHHEHLRREGGIRLTSTGTAFICAFQISTPAHRQRRCVCDGGGGGACDVRHSIVPHSAASLTPTPPHSSGLPSKASSMSLPYYY